MKINKTTWAVLLIAVTLLLNAAAFLWTAKRTPRVAYVRSQDLVYGYLGMKEAMNEFQGKQQQWKGNVDTLQADIQRTMAGLPADGKSDPMKIRRLQKQRQDLAHYQQAMGTKMQEDQQRMLNGVLGQVNAFVEKYAKEKGFDLVLGTTDAGSLLYGKGAMDITDELLAALNADHEKGGRP
jgi:outer membrane protein